MIIILKHITISGDIGQALRYLILPATLLFVQNLVEEATQKHRSSALLCIWEVNPPLTSGFSLIKEQLWCSFNVLKRPVMWKAFPCHYIIMFAACHPAVCVNIVMCKWNSSHSANCWCNICIHMYVHIEDTISSQVWNLYQELTLCYLYFGLKHKTVQVFYWWCSQLSKYMQWYYSIFSRCSFVYLYMNT